MKTTLRSQDLTCPSCIVKTEDGLQGLDGVSTAKVQFNSGRIEVEYDESQTSVAAIQDLVRKLG
jgi:copper chaperone CopZ